MFNPTWTYYPLPKLLQAILHHFNFCSIWNFFEIPHLYEIFLRDLERNITPLKGNFLEKHSFWNCLENIYFNKIPLENVIRVKFQWKMFHLSEISLRNVIWHLTWQNFYSISIKYLYENVCSHNQKRTKIENN